MELRQRKVIKRETDQIKISINQMNVEKDFSTIERLSQILGVSIEKMDKIYEGLLGRSHFKDVDMKEIEKLIGVEMREKQREVVRFVFNTLNVLKVYVVLDTKILILVDTEMRKEFLLSTQKKN